MIWALLRIQDACRYSTFKGGVMKSKNLFYLAPFAIGLLIPAVVGAKECSGHYSNTNLSSETSEIEKGYTLTFFTMRGDARSENSPYNGVGMCGGYALTTPDGKTFASGICSRKGENGGWSDAWSMRPGDQRGEWHQVAGTGVFANNNGNKGWWQDTVDDGKTHTGNWAGDCK
jgi:hypothetical protein